MGYYSTAYCGEFKSKHTAEECEAIRARVLEKKENKFFGSLTMIEYVEFTQSGDADDNGFYTIYPEFVESNGKWYDDCEFGLAKLIALLIAPNDYCDLTMDGEDSESWGYRIREGKITKLCKEWTEDDRKPFIVSKESFVEEMV